MAQDGRLTFLTVLASGFWGHVIELVAACGAALAAIKWLSEIVHEAWATWPGVVSRSVAGFLAFVLVLVLFRVLWWHHHNRRLRKVFEQSVRLRAADYIAALLGDRLPPCWNPLGASKMAAIADHLILAYYVDTSTEFRTMLNNLYDELKIDTSPSPDSVAGHRGTIARILQALEAAYRSEAVRSLAETIPPSDGGVDAEPCGVDVLPAQAERIALAFRSQVYNPLENGNGQSDKHKVRQAEGGSQEVLEMLDAFRERLRSTRGAAARAFSQQRDLTNQRIHCRVKA